MGLLLIAEFGYNIATMIIFLYGPDDFRARQKITELRQKFTKEIDPTGSSVISIDGTKTTLKEVSDAYRPASLFSKKRFISLGGIMENKRKEIIDELEEFLKQEKDNENILVVYEEKFIEKKIAGKNLIMKPGPDDKAVPLNKSEKKLFDRLNASHFAQFFGKLSPADLQKTLAALAKQNGVALTLPAAQLLIRLVGSDLWPLSQEVAKLAAYVLARSENGEAAISEKDVQSMVSQSVTNTIFALTDALGNRQSGLALKLFQEQIESGAHPHYLLTMILWQFKTLASVRQSLDSGQPAKDLAKSLGLHPYVLEKSINQVRKFSLPVLTTAINRFVELDYKSKSGQGKIEELLPVVLASL
jgi:DNA polymerase-3 subunit delta